LRRLRNFSAYFALLVAAVVAGPAGALEFRSIADELGVLYDAPSKDSAKRLILTKGYPVEVIIASGDWVRVRDANGTFAWIEAGRLAAKRMVLVAVPGADARDAPDKTAPSVFKAEKGVILELVGVSGGWAKVRHRSGTVAFIRLGDLWGV
jgi:SH3-like domain-containing protein